MTEDNNESSHFILPAPILIMLLSAAGLGGGGLYGVVGPQLEKSAIEACYANSSTALDVAGQHGQELVEIRTELADTRKLIYDRTQYRWTAEDQARYNVQHGIDEATQNRRIDWLEKQLEAN